jgi:hypothetical protein
MTDKCTDGDTANPACVSPSVDGAFANDGETTKDVIFGKHGWYAIIENPGGGPGDEFTIRFSPHSAEVLRDLETQRQGSQESCPA